MTTDAIRWSEIEELAQHRGHFRRQVEYDTCYVALHRYRGDGEGYDLHAHVETQVGLVLDGEMAMLFEESPIAVEAGQSYVIPTGMRHGGKAASPESLVLNIYVKKPLVRGVGEAARRDDWPDARPPVLACGVRQSRHRVGEHQALPALSGESVDTFDIVTGGEVDMLVRGDVIRGGGPRASRAGQNGATLFRIEILGG